MRWQTHHDDEDRQKLIDWASTAVDRYPSNPRLHAWLAEALAEIGSSQRAADEARTTIRLHTLLEQHGHVDKLLSDERIEEMRALVTPPGTPVP